MTTITKTLIGALPKLCDDFAEGAYKNTIYYACIVHKDGISMCEESFFLGYGIADVDGIHTSSSAEQIQKSRYQPHWEIIEFEDLEDLEELGEEFCSELTELFEDEDRSEEFDALLEGAATILEANYGSLFKALFLAPEFCVIRDFDGDQSQLPEVSFPFVDGKGYSLQQSVDRKLLGEAQWQQILESLGDISELGMEEFFHAYCQAKTQFGF